MQNWSMILVESRIQLHATKNPTSALECLYVTYMNELPKHITPILKILIKRNKNESYQEQKREIPYIYSDLLPTASFRCTSSARSKLTSLVECASTRTRTYRSRSRAGAGRSRTESRSRLHVTATGGGTTSPRCELTTFVKLQHRCGWRCGRSVAGLGGRTIARWRGRTIAGWGDRAIAGWEGRWCVVSQKVRWPIETWLNQRLLQSLDHGALSRQFLF